MNASKDREDSNILMTIEEVAEYLRVPVSSVYKMTCPSAELQIPRIKIGGRLRFRRTDIDQFLTQLTIKG